MKKFLTYIYKALVFLSVVAGVISFYGFITEKSDFELIFAIDEQNQIIENNTGLDNLKIVYKNVEVDSLFGTKIILKNNGEKAISKDFMFKPLKVFIQPDNSFLNINTAHSITSSEQEFTVNIDLLNPDESIEFYILTTKKPILKLDYKIREISEIIIWNKLTDPPLNKKFFDINWLWFLLLITSLLATIDAIFLVKEDKKLGDVFSLIKNIQFDKEFDKQTTIDELATQYSEYSDSLPFTFIDTNFLIEEVSNKIDSLDTSNELDRHTLYKFTNSLVRHGNLYDLRSINIFAGPVIFLGSFLGILYNLIF